MAVQLPADLHIHENDAYLDRRGTQHVPNYFLATYRCCRTFPSPFPLSPLALFALPRTPGRITIRAREISGRFSTAEYSYADVISPSPLPRRSIARHERIKRTLSRLLKKRRNNLTKCGLPRYYFIRVSSKRTNGALCKLT